MPKNYPKPYEMQCPYLNRCPYRVENVKEVGRNLPRLYGRRKRCHYVNIFKCPYEEKYPSGQPYDDSYPYPFFKSFF